MFAALTLFSGGPGWSGNGAIGGIWLLVLALVVIAGLGCLGLARERWQGLDSRGGWRHVGQHDGRRVRGNRSASPRVWRYLAWLSDRAARTRAPRARVRFHPLGALTARVRHGEIPCA